MIVLGIDIGSSAVRVGVLRKGRIIGRVSRQPFETRYEGLRAEVKPADVLRAVTVAIRGTSIPRAVDVVALSVMSPAWIALDRRGGANTADHPPGSPQCRCRARSGTSRRKIAAPSSGGKPAVSGRNQLNHGGMVRAPCAANRAPRGSRRPSEHVSSSNPHGCGSPIRRTHRSWDCIRRRRSAAGMTSCVQRPA